MVKKIIDDIIYTRSASDEVYTRYIAEYPHLKDEINPELSLRIRNKNWFTFIKSKQEYIVDLDIGVKEILFRSRFGEQEIVTYRFKIKNYSLIAEDLTIFQGQILTKLWLRRKEKELEDLHHLINDTSTYNAKLSDDELAILLQLEEDNRSSQNLKMEYLLFEDRRTTDLSFNTSSAINDKKLKKLVDFFVDISEDKVTELQKTFKGEKGKKLATMLMILKELKVITFNIGKTSSERGPFFKALKEDSNYNPGGPNDFLNEDSKPTITEEDKIPQRELIKKILYP